MAASSLARLIAASPCPPLPVPGREALYLVYAALQLFTSLFGNSLPHAFLISAPVPQASRTALTAPGGSLFPLGLSQQCVLTPLSGKEL